MKIINFINFITILKTGFESHFTDLKNKTQNIRQLNNSSFTLQPDGKWVKGGKSVLKCNKTSLQIKIIT